MLCTARLPQALASRMRHALRHHHDFSDLFSGAQTPSPAAAATPSPPTVPTGGLTFVLSPRPPQPPPPPPPPVAAASSTPHAHAAPRRTPTRPTSAQSRGPHAAPHRTPHRGAPTAKHHPTASRVMPARKPHAKPHTRPTPTTAPQAAGPPDTAAWTPSKAPAEAPPQAARSRMTRDGGRARANVLRQSRHGTAMFKYPTCCGSAGSLPARNTAWR